MLNLTDLLRVPHVDSLFDISSHNKIAFAWNKTGEWQIYETRLPSPSGRRAGDEGEITPITHTSGGKFNPRYSPNGQQLAYAFDIDGSESYHLIVYDFESKQHTDLTSNISHALQPNFCWSPNGQHLALLSNQHGHFSAHTISVNGGTPKLILDTGHPAWQVEWSPDGKHLAVCCEMHGQDYGIFIVNLETKKVTPLCHPERQRRVSTTASEILRSAQNDILNAFAPQWTPDGKGLLFHSDANGWFNIGLYDVDSKEITWQTNSEGDSQTPTIVSSTMNNSHLKHQIAYAQSRDALNWVEIKSVGQAFSLTTNGGLATRPTADAKKYQVGKGIHSGIKFTSEIGRAHV